MLINRKTGQPATEAERRAAERRAVEILSNPYASPEQMEWAILVAPTGFEMTFWESTNDRRSNGGRNA